MCQMQENTGRWVNFMDINTEWIERGVLAAYLMWTGYHDIRRRAVPLTVLAVGGLLLLLDVVFTRGEADRVLAVIPGICLFLLAMVTKGIGRADGILLSYVGYVYGGKNILTVFAISLIYIFFYSMFLFTKEGNRGRQIPYIPFLLAACITGWKIL